MELVFEPDAPVTGRGDDRARFAELARPHWDSMARLARRLAPAADWEDVLQNALAAAWRKRGQFDPERGAARSWLLAIVADQAYKAHRSGRRRDGAELVDVPVTGPDPSARFDLDRGLRSLSQRQQTAVALHYYLDLPLAEVAEAMDCSVGTVKSTLADARAKLRRELGEDYR